VPKREPEIVKKVASMPMHIPYVTMDYALPRAKVPIDQVERRGGIILVDAGGGRGFDSGNGIALIGLNELRNKE
jgi:hypothetical protein